MCWEQMDCGIFAKFTCIPQGIYLGQKYIQMKKITPLLLIGLFFAMLGHAQHPSCDGIRYLNPVFPQWDSTAGLKFGENYTYNNNLQELFLDVYEPTGDTEALRPAIVFAYGGSFIGGQRDDVAGLCKTFASLGYVTVSFDYRLFDNGIFTDTVQAVDAVLKAVGDMKAAVRYLKEDAATMNRFKIDTNYIFAGGISAGGITALHLAYFNAADTIPTDMQPLVTANGGLEGNTSSNYQYSSKVAGVLNYSGALKDANWLDAGEVPLYSAHDTGDNVVPYGSGRVVIGFFVSIFLEGSGTLETRANAEGVTNELYSVNSANHVGYFSNAQQTADVTLGSMNFLYDILCPSVVSNDVPVGQELRIYPVPADEFLKVEIPAEWGNASAELFSVDGRLVKSETGNAVGTMEMDVQDLAPGIYILKVQSETANAVKRVVID